MPSSPPRSTLFPYTMLFRSQRANLCTRILCPLLRCGFVPDRRDKTRANKKRSEEHTSELQSLRHLVCRLHLRDLHSFPTRCSSDLNARIFAPGFSAHFFDADLFLIGVTKPGRTKSSARPRLYTASFLWYIISRGSNLALITRRPRRVEKSTSWSFLPKSKKSFAKPKRKMLPEAVWRWTIPGCARSLSLGCSDVYCFRSSSIFLSSCCCEFEEPES